MLGTQTKALAVQGQDGLGLKQSPAPSASRSRCGTARPTLGGPPESTWGAFSRNAAARRFGDAKPSSQAQGQRVNERSRTEWQAAWQKRAWREKITKKYKSHPLTQIVVFERHHRT